MVGKLQCRAIAMTPLVAAGRSVGVVQDQVAQVSLWVAEVFTPYGGPPFGWDWVCEDSFGVKKRVANCAETPDTTRRAVKWHVLSAP